MCEDRAYFRCDLCNSAICVQHSRPFSYGGPDKRNDQVSSRICWECDEADALSSERFDARRKNDKPEAGPRIFSKNLPPFSVSLSH